MRPAGIEDDAGAATRTSPVHSSTSEGSVRPESGTPMFEQLLESAPDAIVGIDSDGEIVLVNSQTERLFGYTREELLGNTIETLVPDRFRGAHTGHRHGYFTDPRTRPMGAGLELYGMRKGGIEFPAEISLSSIKTKEGTLATAAIRDISDRKAAERQLARHAEELARSNAELQQFAYVASHDLQEPLRMVLTYTEILAEAQGDQMDPDTEEAVGFIIEGATRMQALIEGVLEFSRVRREQTDPRETDVQAVLERALANLRAAITESGATVTHDSLPVVSADSVQLVQLFQNLVGNAIKFRGEEPPRVHVSAVADGNEWIFSVSDNGIGIEPEYRERIFGLFERLHSKDEYVGAGIGLALCKRIVEGHGGRMWLEPADGSGSTFHFSLLAGGNGAT